MSLVDDIVKKSKSKPNSKAVFEAFGDLVSRALGGNIEKKIEKLQENENNGILFTKDKSTDQLRWMGIYSSNYLDDDYPADIISAQAHKEFIERAEKGEAPYPELWHAHTEGTKWGTTDFLAFDEDTGVAYASGLVDKGHEKEAYALAKYGKGRLGLSHGMERKSLRRDDPDDDRVITQYNSYEISDLPLRWAANGMTALSFSETTTSKNTEDGMAISERKKQYLTDAGLSEEQVAELEQLGKEQAELNAERPRKEKPEEDTAKGAEAQEEQPAKESETAEGEVGEENDTEKEGNEAEQEEQEAVTLSKEEALAVIAKGFEDFGGAVAEVLEKIDARLAKVEQLEKARAEKEKEQMLAPAYSGILEKISAIGAKETELGDEDDLLKDRPEETEFDDSSIKSGRDIVANAIGTLFKQ